MKTAERADFSTLRLERDGPVARVTLARPEVRNAFNAEMIGEVTACFSELAKDEELRAVVISGEGALFCAGADVTWMRASANATRDENREDALRMAGMFLAIDEFPAPVVARVQGGALGGGVGIVACCDVVVAAADARFAFSEVRLGILPAVISRFALAKIGRSQARRWFLTGESMTGARAAAIGLVHEAVPAEELDATTEKIVQALVTNGPRAIREAKRMIRRVATLPRDDAIEFAVETIARIRVTTEAQEGLRAFLEKREPGWRTGRGSPAASRSS